MVVGNSESLVVDNNEQAAVAGNNELAVADNKQQVVLGNTGEAAGVYARDYDVSNHAHGVHNHHVHKIKAKTRLQSQIIKVFFSW